jgi:DNA repair exonuclease SbcCD ATPase subunit
MKAQERNDYITIWLPNLSEYFDGYKTALKQYNLIKKQIELLNTDIGKLSSVSYESEINNLSNSILTVEKEYNKIIENINKHETYINLFPTYTYFSIEKTIEEFKEKVLSLNNKYEELTKVLKEVIKYSGKDGKEKIFKDLTLSEKNLSLYGEKVNNIDNELIKINTSLEEIKISKDFNKEEYKDLFLNLEHIEKEISYYEELKNTELKNNPFYEEFILKDITGTKFESFKLFFNDLITIYERISDLVQLDFLFNEEVFNNRKSSLLLQKESLSNCIQKLDNDISLISNRIYALEHSTLNKNLLELRPKDCSISCGIIDEILKYIYPEEELKTLHKKLSDLIQEKTSIIKNEEDLLIEIQKSSLASDFIIELNNKIFRQSALIAEFPSYIKDFFSDKDIFSIFSNLPKMQKSFSQFDNFISLLDKIKTLNDTHKGISLKQKEMKITADLFDNYQKELIRFKELSNNRENLIQIYKSEEDTVKKLKSINNIIEDSKKEIDSYNILADNLTKQKISLKRIINRWYIKGQFERNLSVLNVRKIEKKEILENYKEELNILQNKKSTITVLTDTRDKYIEKNKKLFAMLNIWSPKVGYPAWEMEDFLDTLTEQTNKDLNQMWGSSLLIEQFKVGANEFSISVNRDGTILEDVSECSEGERATLALAISFAIIEINLKERPYNNIRLDESDATLDQERRRTFISTILNRMPSLDCGDLWMCTHNDEINDIEADIVLLKGANTSTINLSNKNILFQVGGNK